MTTFIMPTAPTTQTITPPAQFTASPTHFNHGASQQPQHPQLQSQYQHYFTSHAAPVSPLTSQTTSPHNASPTSPRATFSSQQPPHAQPSSTAAPLQQQHLVRNLQLRPPKSPLYVPAVLRPTEPPRSKKVVKPSPLTPPRSAGSSFDNLEAQAALAGVGALDAKVRPLSRRSTIDSGKWVGEKGKEVTRRHWLPDTSSPTCTSSICARSFSFYTRRHHCRRCGHIFCSAHSAASVPLDSDANFDLDGCVVRACENCFDEFVAWDMAREERSRSNSESSDDTVPQSPAVAMGGAKKGALKGLLGGQEMGQSVPRDWSWSTF